MVPVGTVVQGGGDTTPASSAAGDDRDYGNHNHLLIPLFLAAAFLFFVAYQLFGVAAATGVLAFFLVLAVVFHRVHVSRAFPFLHVSLGPANDAAAAAGGADFRTTAAVSTGAAAIAALPVAFGYKRDQPGTTGWAQCAICLGLVRVGEVVRRLPACGRLFHAGCIDKWLHAHATCPLCRTTIFATAAATTVPAVVR